MEEIFSSQLGPIVGPIIEGNAQIVSSSSSYLYLLDIPLPVRYSTAALMTWVNEIKFIPWTW